MAKSKTPKMTPAEQLKRFKDMARELGTDESPDALEKALKRVTKRSANPKR